MRSNEAFTLFFDVVEISRKTLGVDPATLPRKRKAPVRYEIHYSTGSHPETPEDHHRKIYFEALYLAIACIKDRFDQPGYAVYRNLEEILALAANGTTNTSQFEAFYDFYGKDVDKTLLSVQLLSLGSFLLVTTRPRLPTALQASAP